MDDENLAYVAQSVANANKIAEHASETQFSHILLYGDFNFPTARDLKALVEKHTLDKIQVSFISRPWVYTKNPEEPEDPQVDELWKRFRGSSDEREFDHLPLQICVIGHRSGFVEGAGFVGIPIFYLNNERESIAKEKDFMARGDTLWRPLKEYASHDRLRSLADVMNTFIPIESFGTPSSDQDNTASKSTNATGKGAKGTKVLGNSTSPASSQNPTGTKKAAGSTKGTRGKEKATSERTSIEGQAGNEGKPAKEQPIIVKKPPPVLRRREKYKDELAAALFMYMCCDLKCKGHRDDMHPSPAWTMRVDLIHDEERKEELDRYDVAPFDDESISGSRFSLTESIVRVFDTPASIQKRRLLRLGIGPKWLKHRFVFAMNSIQQRRRIKLPLPRLLPEKLRSGWCHMPVSLSDCCPYTQIHMDWINVRADLDEESWTQLTWAVEQGDKIKVETSLKPKEKVDPNEMDDFGHTPLSLTAGKGNDNIVKLLLRAKANPNLKDKWGDAPLLLAAKLGHEAIVELLLNAKADPNVKDGLDGTPLQYAATIGHKAMVERLLKDKAIPDSKSAFDGSTPLFCAAENGHDSIVELLLKTNSVDVNTVVLDRHGIWSSPLLSAAKRGHAAVVRLLLGAQADVTFCSKRAQTALAPTTKSMFAKAAKWLFTDDEVDVDAKNNDERTPLMWAAENGYKDVVKLLQAHPNTSKV
ncbi:MAG: hypothetical protein M1824_005630 [Vezdaea acicularis]|nr:MAG: hypothetical protein M1824_005630 [Vezdaea acicularis]